MSISHLLAIDTTMEVLKVITLIQVVTGKLFIHPYKKLLAPVSSYGSISNMNYESFTVKLFILMYMCGNKTVDPRYINFF